MPQTCTQLNSVCLSFVDTGERIYLNNVKAHFVISMMREVYRQKSYIHKLVKKLETTRGVFARHAGGRNMCDRTVQDVNHTKIKMLLRTVWVSQRKNHPVLFTKVMWFSDEEDSNTI
jgi:hypothetical protein